ncbi:unnamed protein product [Caenorhabditis angaria]|uniref:Domain of unknown function DB domain-containing protein n=1 Tax=Caenorhabditis angaria TaxID=860376 RepID=A0A9P1IDN7_9PELO|nr:unnamed protein product [Caenorhabditis angaria]
MNKTILFLLLCFLYSTVSAQYFEWPQQQQWNFQQQPQWNFQQQQQPQPQYYQQQQQQQYNRQYFPQQQQQQPQYYQPQQQFQQPQVQQQQYQPQAAPPQRVEVPSSPPPPQQQPAPQIYSQTVVIPQAPPPPPEAYQQSQYAPQQTAPIFVEAANIPRYHQKPASEQLQHIDRARSISSFDVDNRILREQPNSFAQNQEKIQLLAQPPPPPPPPAHTQAPLIRVPPPPARFIPNLSTLYGIDSPPQHEKNPSYTPDHIKVDNRHSAYFEDTQRTRPQTPKTRVTGGSVHSSSAAAVQPQQQVQRPRVTPSISATPSQPQQQRPSAPRPVTRRPTVPVNRVRPQPSQTVRRPEVVATTAPPARSHLVPTGGEKPKTASGKFLQCCQNRKVVKACERICSFDVLSKKTLTGMFLGTDPCPQAHGLDLMQCAADSDDHTQCCIEKEVDRTSAGKKCLGFCNMKPGVTFQADVSMLPCWGVLNDIKQCFKENLERQLAAS